MTKKRKTDDVFKIYRSAVKQYPIIRFVVATKCVEYLHQFETAQLFYNLKKKKEYERERDRLLAAGKLEEADKLPIPPMLDFSQFLVTDTIIQNTFEIGLVSDERKKGDVVGRKGILAADLRKREIAEEDDDEEAGDDE